MLNIEEYNIVKSGLSIKPNKTNIDKFNMSLAKIKKENLLYSIFFYNKHTIKAGLDFSVGQWHYKKE